jgi:lipopolysaccharide/colanic/teichoic acid biosynthesis glycosyltransferase
VYNFTHFALSANCAYFAGLWIRIPTFAGQFQRYLFTCGLTGPFQVVKDAKVKYNQNQIDMDYILFCKAHSGWKIFLKDISILWQTVLIVSRAKGI